MAYTHANTRVSAHVQLDVRVEVSAVHERALNGVTDALDAVAQLVELQLSQVQRALSRQAAQAGGGAAWPHERTAGACDARAEGERMLRLQLSVGAYLSAMAQPAEGR